MRSVLLLTALFSVLGCGHTARILAMYPFPGKSHHIYESAVINVLLQRGHEVVEYSPFPPKKIIPKHTHVEIHNSMEKVADSWTWEDLLNMVNSPKFGAGFIFVWTMLYQMCTEVFENEKIQHLLNSNEHFDLVITESAFGQESMLIFGEKFKAPTVTLVGTGSWSVVNMDAGNSLSIAAIPDFDTVATDQMSFKDRLWNFISIMLTLTVYYNYHLPKQDHIMKQGYGRPAPPLADLVKNTSLYFVNAHPGIEYARPYTPNIIPIGGITISDDRVSLPQEVQKFMESGKEGVIYFSLGTVVPANNFPPDILKTFVNVFKTLKYKVLWKIGMDTIPGLTPNVMLTKWVPQPGVLAHKNCILFITHGGQFSLLDAINAGVPTIGIPFFGDQETNIKLSEYRGFGVKLDIRTLSEECLSTALSTVLDNPKYKQNAMRLSRIFKDRPQTPADMVVYWVEYLIRHGGAPHLRPVSSQLSWYQLALLDVLLVCLVTVITLLACIYLALRKILRFVLYRTEKTVNEKKNK